MLDERLTKYSDRGRIVPSLPHVPPASLPVRGAGVEGPAGIESWTGVMRSFRCGVSPLSLEARQ